MFKKTLSIFISAALLSCALNLSVFAAMYGESYVFRLSNPAASPELTKTAEMLSAETGLYRTDSYALIRKLDSVGALETWGVDYQVPLDGVVEELQSERTNDYRAAMLGYSYIREKNITGQGIKVGVVDTGLWSGFSEMTQATILEGVNVLAKAGSEERSNTEDIIGHGTFVTSIICGENIGLATNVSILPLKCYDNNKTTQVSYIVAAIEEAIAQECDVINLSLGETLNNTVMEETVKKALAAGIIIVAAGGNLSGYSTGHDPLYYPAAYEGVIGVGALNSTKFVLNKAAQNGSIYVTAPGVSVKGISKSGSFAAGSGTSYAAPVVTALAAVALSVDPELTSEDFAALLAETAEDLGAEGRDNSYGYGLVNPALLLETLLQDSESMVLTAWDGGLGLTMWISPAIGSPILACYTNSGKLQKVVFPKSLCCFPLENDTGSLTLFYLGDEFQPLCESKTMQIHDDIKKLEQ